ncbi:MAG: hypothetical protein ACI9HK_004541 [Pirellulaceae bacterium]|jgi:hypothetical protein
MNLNATRNSRLISTLHWLAVVAVCFLSGESRGDEHAIKLRQLVERNWSTTPILANQLEPAFKKLQAEFDDSTPVLYALSLVQMRKRRYADAKISIDSVVGRKPDNFSARQAQIWLSLLLKQHDSALHLLEKLSADLAAIPPARAANVDVTALVGFMGRAIGFLDGPASNVVNESTRRTYQQKIEGHLTLAQQLDFNDARRSVVTKFSNIIQEADLEKAKQEDVTKTIREEAIKDVKDREQVLDTQRQQTIERQQSLNEQARAESRKIDDAEKPLLNRLYQADASASVIERELVMISSDIYRIEELLEFERNPINRRQLLRDLDYLYRLGANYRRDLSAFSGQVNGLQYQRAALNQQRGQLQQDVFRSQSQANAELRKIEKQQSASKRAELRARKTKPPLQRMRVLKIQSSAVTTYIDFPLESEKQRLFESLK